MADEFSCHHRNLTDSGSRSVGDGSEGIAGSGEVGDSSMDLTGYLETYMGQRAAQGSGDVGSGGGGSNGPSVYTELQRREQDLMVAAQLGRALLASNAELQHRNQRIAEEFGDRIQRLEREKAGLRAKLDAVEQDYDSQMRELQSDVLSLRDELRRQQLGRMELERERAAQAAALGRANERLAEESRQRRQAEQRAAGQSAELQAELRARRAAMQEHLAQLAQLKEQLHALHAQKAELERLLVQVAEERDALLSAAEDQQLAIARLQRRDCEQSDTIAAQEAQIHDLQATAACLHRQVEALAPQAARSEALSMLMMLEAPPAGGESLFSELGGEAQQFGWRQSAATYGEEEEECDFDEDVEDDEAAVTGAMTSADFEDGSGGFGAASAPAAPSRPNYLFATYGEGATAAAAAPAEDDDDVEIDDEVYLRSTLSDLSSPPDLPHDDDYEYDYEGDYAVGAAGGLGVVEMNEMRGEVLEVYYQLRGMCADLGRRRRGAGGSQPGKTPDELAMVEMDFRLGSLRQVLVELRGLIGDIGDMREGATDAAASNRVQAQVVESLKEQVRQKDRELEAKSSELQRLSEDLQNVQLNIQQQESLILQDSAEARARSELHGAVQRRSGLHEQLARMHAEVDRLNGELSRAAEERGELSDQIGRWSNPSAALCSLAEPESSDLSQSLASGAKSPPTNQNRPA